MKKTWIGEETKGSSFSDVRLGRRYESLIEQLSEGIGESIPMACQDWANTKGAYRFFSNSRVTEGQILEGHFQASHDRCAAIKKERLLILHDTTEFSYQRGDRTAIGITHKIPHGRLGMDRAHTVCGLLMHSSLVVTASGLPLGLAAIKFWTRKKFKGSQALRENFTRIPIAEKESIRWIENLKQSTLRIKDPDRCVHIGDRESDIYEFFCAAREMSTHFVVRMCNDRLAEDGTVRVLDELDKSSVRGVHTVSFKDPNQKWIHAKLDVKFQNILFLPPAAKKRHYSEISLWVIQATQKKKNPGSKDKIDWRIITDLPIHSLEEATEKLNWYAMRWKIEVFHKILKSGCKAEESKLRTAERLTKLISVFCILSWRVFWITMLNRTYVNAKPTSTFTEPEIQLLDRLVPNKKAAHQSQKNVSYYILKLAKLGGYLARSGDSPPGNTVIWRGLSRLTDIQLGFELAQRLVGN